MGLTDLIRVTATFSTKKHFPLGLIFVLMFLVPISAQAAGSTCSPNAGAPIFSQVVGSPLVYVVVPMTNYFTIGNDGIQPAACSVNNTLSCAGDIYGCPDEFGERAFNIVATGPSTYTITENLIFLEGCNAVTYVFDLPVSLGTFTITIPPNTNPGAYESLPSYNVSCAATAHLGALSTSNQTLFSNEPVNTATGNYFSSHTDLSVVGRGLPFVFNRYYNSLDAFGGPMGTGWRHSYDLVLSVGSGGQVTIKQADGSTTAFSSGGGIYTPALSGVFDTLVQNSDGSFTLTHKNQIKLNFSSAGQLTSVRDRNGNTQTLAYSSGNLTSITDTSGRVFALVYDTNNHLVSMTDPAGRIIHYSYDSLGNLVSYQDALGGITQYTYDANGHLISATDPRGVQYVQNTYDGLGRVVSQQNGRGFTTTFAYDTPSTGTTTITDPLGNVTQHVYDSTPRIVQVINAQGGTTSYTYDSNNDKTAITNPNSQTTNFAYDGNGNVTGVTDALGNTAAFTYDTRNDILSATNPAGSTSTFAYDPKGNLISIQDALGNKTAFVYDGLGELISRTDALGHTSSLTYDSAGDVYQNHQRLGEHDGAGL